MGFVMSGGGSTLYVGHHTHWGINEMGLVGSNGIRRKELSHGGMESGMSEEVGPGLSFCLRVCGWLTLVVEHFLCVHILCYCQICMSKSHSPHPQNAAQTVHLAVQDKWWDCEN